MTDTADLDVVDLFNTEDALSTVQRLESVMRRMKDLENEKDDLTTQVKQALADGALHEDDVLIAGLTPCHREGGYDDGAIVVFKQHGLTDAFATKEVLDQKAAKEYVASGRVPAEDVADFKKPDTLYFTLPRGKKGSK